MGTTPRPIDAAALLQLSSAALNAYQVGDSAAALRAGHLAERTQRLLTGYLHPELAPTQQSSPAATALSWFAADCADDEHLACWLRRQLAEFGIADVLARDCGGYPAPVASFRIDPTAYAWVRLTELPPPHNPFRCDWFADFGHLLQSERRKAALMQLLGQRRGSDEVRRRAGTRFRRRCPDRPRCRWHDENEPWLEALPFARLVQQHVDNWDERSVRQAIEDKVPVALRRAVASLFFDPIVYPPGAAQVDNGQHRILALYAAGATDVLVATR